jgi:outer membrane protein W
MKKSYTLAAAIIALAVPSYAHADGTDSPVPSDSSVPTDSSVPSHRSIWDQPPHAKFYFRAGWAFITPFSSSNAISLSNVSGPASLVIGNGPIPGSGATIDAASIPAVIVGYVLPWWGGKVSLETILGTPFTASFRATGTIANQSLAPTALGLPTGIQPLGSQFGKATALPPIGTVVYSLPALGPVRPYAGAGVSVLFAYNTEITNPMLTAYGKPTLSVSPAPGLVLQSGFDATIYKRVYARVDVKFIALMLAQAEIDNVKLMAPDLPLFGAIDVGTVKTSMWVNPLIVQAAIGTNF